MSTANWPIRVGGEYRAISYPKTQYARVTAIDGDRIHYEMCRFDGTEHTFARGNEMGADAFRMTFIPEDQSPVPALVEALKDQLQLMAGYKSRLECDGAHVSARQVQDRIEMVTAVLAKAEAGVR